MKNQKLKGTISNPSKNVKLTQEEELEAITDLLTRYVNGNTTPDTPSGDYDAIHNKYPAMPFTKFIIHRFTRVQ